MTEVHLFGDQHMKVKNIDDWLFQCNPASYDLHTYLKEHRDYIYWIAPQHAKRIKIGDSAFIWRAGTSAAFPRGIVAYGVVCEAATPRNKVRHPRAIRADLCKNPADADKKGLDIGIKLYGVRLTLEEGMISDSLIAEDEVLSKMTIMKIWRQTNYPLTNNEATLLKKLWGVLTMIVCWKFKMRASQSHLLKVN